MADPGAGWSDGLLEAGLGSARAADLLGWPARVARMLDAETALARAQAREGIVTSSLADAIAAACDPRRIDLDALAREAAVAATPVIPLLEAVRAHLADDARRALQLGATSQDIVDTAAMLQVGDALALLETLLVEVAGWCAALADQHRATVIPGRTLGQQAVPITFGLVAARWLAALDRRVAHLRIVRPRVLVVQLGGAAGTLGPLDEAAMRVAAAFAQELDLGVPDLPWHAERDRVVELAGSLAAVTAVVSKIAGYIVDRSATEVGEVVTGPRRGAGSSAMPHKRRNPVDAVAARAAARLADGELTVLFAAAGHHEYERAAGAWQAEWVAIPSAMVRTIGAVERLGAAVEVLEVDPDRGQHNLAANLHLAASEALVVALSEPLGRPRAGALVADLVARAVEQRRDLAEVAAEDHRVTSALAPERLTEAMDVRRSIATAGAWIDAALDRHRALVADREAT
jgi:3-carboxy-cis,cis-muconate cycloisomerase